MTAHQNRTQQSGSRVRRGTPGTRRWIGRLTVLQIGLVLLALVTLLAFPAFAQAVSYSTQERQFLTLINDYREQNGLSPLLLSDLASDSSEKHSHDMAAYNFFSHTTEASDYFSVGTTYLGRMRACGYTFNTYTGENIAAGQSTAQAVFNAWKGSSGHRANMLNANFKVIGIGYEYRSGSTYGHYWTTDFGGYVDSTAGGGGGGGTTDTTAPTVDITAPADGATVAGTVQIRIDAIDNVGVTKVELRVDGTLAATDTGYPYGFDWVTTASNNGQHTLQARGYDAAGNTKNDQITITVANEVSTTTTTKPPTTTTLAPTTTTTKPPTTTTKPPTTTTLAPTTTTTKPPTTTTTTVSVPPPTTTTTVPSTGATTTTTRPSTTSTTRPPTTSTTVSGGAFVDVPSTHPYAEEISLLASRSIVLGKGDGRFYPDAPVVRQQFAKMIVLSLALPVSEADTPPFDDVDLPLDNLYPDNYVAVCAAEGITVGTGPRRFSPWDSITRAQLITMVARATGLPEPPAGYRPVFDDFSPTHYPWARRAAYAGALVGLEGMGPDYDFWAPATRGEVCALLEEVLDRE